MTFATYYAKKRGEGKPHRVAITHVAKKLIRVIYALERQDIDFNAQKLRQSSGLILIIKLTEWNCRPPFPFGCGGLQYFYTDFPYVLIKNALSMYGRPVQLYVSILILETVSPILHEMSHSLMVCRSVSMVCFFCSLMFRLTACISSSVVVDSCQLLFTIIFLDLLLVLEVSGCFSYNGMGFRLQLPFRIFLCGYRKLFSINRTVYNNISFTHLLR